MTYLRDVPNQYGQTASLHRCDFCGDEFTIMPPIRKDEKGCCMTWCSSYDPKRDVDIMFPHDEWPESTKEYYRGRKLPPVAPIGTVLRKGDD